MMMTAKVISEKVNVSVFNVPALSGTNFFEASSPAMATCPTIVPTAHDQGDTGHDIPERRVVAESLEARTVVCRSRGVLVEHFAQAVERGVVQPPDFVRGGHGGGNTRTDEDQEGVHQYDHRGDLHFARFDLMSEELACGPPSVR